MSMGSLSSRALRSLPKSYIGSMTKTVMAIGGITRTLAHKVHTPIASPSFTVPTGRKDVKPVEIKPK
ncbi:MAG: hypothetical protein ACFFCD_08425 [Promethearchaeota archaeon]